MSMAMFHSYVNLPEGVYTMDDESSQKALENHSDVEKTVMSGTHSLVLVIFKRF